MSQTIFYKDIILQDSANDIQAHDEDILRQRESLQRLSAHFAEVSSQRPSRRKFLITDFIERARVLDPEISAIALAEQCLALHGIGFSQEVERNISEAARSVLLAEAVNWAAKDIDTGFYTLKPAIFVEAAEQGARSGVYIHYDSHDRTWNIGHAESGVVSYHDPGGEIADQIAERGKSHFHFSEKPFSWSGVTRQERAFLALRHLDYVDNLASVTAPVFEEPPDVPLEKCVDENPAPAECERDTPTDIFTKREMLRRHFRGIER